MKTVYNLELDDFTRRALRARVGKGGLATRHQIRSWLDTLAQTTLEDIRAEYRAELKRREKRRAMRKPGAGKLGPGLGMKPRDLTLIERKIENPSAPELRRIPED